MSSEEQAPEFNNEEWNPSTTVKDEEDDLATIETSINDEADDPEIEAIKARVKEMEEEAEKLKEMQKEAEHSLMSPQSATSSPGLAAEDQVNIDARSVYVGNVDYSATASELEQHFHGCGSVNRVTILCDKFSGHPKGFAYVEFADKDSVDNAVQLTDSLFKGRQIKVNAKRTNRPGISTTNRGFRGGRGRGGRGRSSFHRGFSPRGRGAYRSRRAQWYSPY